MLHLKKLQRGVIKAAVFGANDGIITTFAVATGVAGANLPPQVVLILGIANMIADGISMGLGDFLGELSERKYEARVKRIDPHVGRLGLSSIVTFVSFVVAGSLPL